MHPSVTGHLGVERRREQRALPDGDDPTGGRARPRPGRAPATPSPTSSTHGARMKTACIGPPATPVDVDVGLEGVDLPAEGVAPHRHVDPAEGLLVRRPSRTRSASRIIPAHEPYAGSPARSAARAAARAGRRPGPACPSSSTRRPGRTSRRRRRAPRPGGPAGPSRRARSSAAQVLADVTLQREHTDRSERQSRQHTLGTQPRVRCAGRTGTPGPMTVSRMRCVSGGDAAGGQRGALAAGDGLLLAARASHRLAAGRTGCRSPGTRLRRPPGPASGRSGGATRRCGELRADARRADVGRPVTRRGRATSRARRADAAAGSRRR